MLIKVLVLLLFCLSACAEQTVYEWKDANGNRHYSDKTTQDAKPLKIKHSYRFLSVKKVYDGDTIELYDGTKIRLLGINTPEVQHWDKQADAGGDEAKRWLTQKLKNQKVRLIHDVEKTDKYGRTLAHVFTENKDHINRQLVAAGLAEISIYPPNLLFVDELVNAQNEAEQSGRGIWQRSEYAPIPVSRITNQGRTGWMRIYGKVENVRQTKKSVYLTFSSQFEARIEREWLDLFPDANSYSGKSIEVRGWLNKNRGKFSMLIRHPSAIKDRATRN